MIKLNSILNTPLKSKLIDLIKLRGSLSVSDYMKIVLTKPDDGFYMKNDVFGIKGHFTTSPEISQIFGELIGAWIVQEWHRFNCPTPLRLVEFGPGRGTLASDILRTVEKLTRSGTKHQIKLIEVSERLRKLQAKTLEPFGNVQWYNHIDELDVEEDGFSAFIAHEFLDALPIHKFVREPEAKRWRELLIDYDKNENLRYCIAKQPSLAAKLLIPPDFEGDHIEVCPDAAITVEKVAKRLNKANSGCMLICDYGFIDEPDENPLESSLKVVGRARRDTFRAFKNHESWPTLSDPGDADLTADVDFGYLKKHISSHATVFGPVSQRDFLVKCGIELRLQSLIKSATNQEEQESLTSGVSMLLNEMGERYKFMALFPKSKCHLFKHNPPAGFVMS